MSVVWRWVGEHRWLSVAIAGLVLIWAAGSGSTDSEQAPTPSRDSASQQEPTQLPEPAPSADDTADVPEDDAGQQCREEPRRSRQGSTRPDPAPKPPQPAPAPRTYLVSRVIDGDTLELASGQDVRLVGIDTPEVGECGYDQATANLSYLVLGKQVRLTMSDENEDRYGRLLRYVNIGEVDAGLRLIKNGLAIARYDSRDGYGFHQREPVYVSADRSNRAPACAPPPAPAPAPQGACAPGYSPCVPPYPPDVDCADVDGPVRVTGTDPHGLDADGDGVACE